MAKVIHNKNNLTEDCQELINANYNRHGTMHNTREMVNYVLHDPDRRVCGKCFTEMIIEYCNG